MDKLTQLAKEYDVYVKSDGAGFKRRARILQSMWREEQGYEAGKHRQRVLGSRLPMPWAKETLANYLTDTIRQVVRAEVLNATADEGKLFQAPRIFNNLLSSQPLCFNLFAELQQDLSLATVVFRKLARDGLSVSPRSLLSTHLGGEILGIRAINRPLMLMWNTRHPREGKGFAGIETKYSEPLGGSAADHRNRYDEVAASMGCFKPDRLDDLKSQPLQQLWRDHLLTGSLLLEDDFDDGFFVFLYPEGNNHCQIVRAWLLV